MNNEFGIPKERIFSSRSADFLEHILQATNRIGVDVVLNSLSGELFHASWKCVAKLGTFVEIGQRDVMGQGLLQMQSFGQNRTFSGFDMQTLTDERPDVVEEFVSLFLKWSYSSC